MDTVFPPPLPRSVRRRSRTAAIWSISLAAFGWVALLVLIGVTLSNKPAANDKMGWFWVGAMFLILVAIFLASVILGIYVFARRKRGRTLAIIAFVLDALPIMVFVASAIQATLKPTNW